MTEAEKQEMVDAAIAADRLRTDPAFQRAILAMRKVKVEALIDADSTDAEANRKLRAEIAAIDDLCGEIAMTITRGMPRATGGVA